MTVLVPSPNSVSIINKAAAAEESLEIVFGREDIVGKMGQYVHFQELLRGLDFRDYGRGVRTVDERIESFKEEHVDEYAGLLVATFNAEPWNDQWTLDTAKQEIRWAMEVPGFVDETTSHLAMLMR